MRHVLLEAFLAEKQVSIEEWSQSGLTWEMLCEIAVDFESRQKELTQSASFHATMLQSLGGVHSVRWRIKNTEHLLYKILRKRIDQEEKYQDINVENYTSKVTDLIGLRALHLFKRDGLEIHKNIVANWQIKEPATAYVRKGDPENLKLQYEECGIVVKEHLSGYRSIHYVTESRPMNRDILCEIQVRTIFEEGWSEVDHKVRYPDLSDDKIVSHFLQIFNSLAGNADEMASFVQWLVEALSSNRLERDKALEERDSAFQDLKKTVELLNTTKQEHSKTRENIEKLQIQLHEYEASRVRSQEFGAFGDSTSLTGIMQRHAMEASSFRSALEQYNLETGLRNNLDASLARLAFASRDKSKIIPPK